MSIFLMSSIENWSVYKNVIIRVLSARVLPIAIKLGVSKKI